jgi:hypothetical protein
MLTPFSHYLQSNQAPSEDETRKIKALRANPLEEISIIDVEIEQIEGILNSLKRKRAHIQKSIDNFNTILAPVRRLSMDVLGVIFSHCFATHRNPFMSASEAPILLTQICRDWRSIALSIPRFWSRLHIPTLRRRPLAEAPPCVLERERRMEAYTEEVQRWLRLSTSCPLAITLMADGDSVSHPPLLDAIIQSSRRWQQLELCFFSSESDILSRFLSLSPDDLCMLRELRVSSFLSVNEHTQEAQEDLWYQCGLLTAQGLRSISFANVHQTDLFPAVIPPNWNNLNHLFIHFPILLGPAHLMLSYCCNLVACRLEIDMNIDTILDTSITLSNASIALSSCILTHLTFLSLEGDLAGCSQLFSSIEAPSLQILDYQGYLPSEIEGFGLLNLLQNVNSLETFRVDHHHLTEKHVLKYYALIPSVTHLVLGRSHKRSFNPNYADPNSQQVAITTLREIRLQYSPDSAPTVLFPSLEIFEAYGISSVTDIMLLEFIKARIDATKSKAGVWKLKKVLVEFLRTRETDIVPEALAYAEAAGIKLELKLTYFTGKKLGMIMSNGWSPDDARVLWVYPLHDYMHMY